MLSKRKSRRKCGYMLLAIISDKAHQLSKRQESRWTDCSERLVTLGVSAILYSDLPRVVWESSSHGLIHRLA